MTTLIIIAVILIGTTFLLKLLQNRESDSPKYNYKQKNFFMSRAEHECYDALLTAVGSKYYVFPQVNLPSIIDNKVVGQNWKAAFRHISQKSVDFVLCDKEYISPKLAIELDDVTHKREDRIERDQEVERILKNAKLPLLRLENHGSFNTQELIFKIETTLKN